jgi:hypothetical protein
MNHSLHETQLRIREIRERGPKALEEREGRASRGRFDLHRIRQLSPGVREGRADTKGRAGDQRGSRSRNVSRQARGAGRKERSGTAHIRPDPPRFHAMKAAARSALRRRRGGGAALGGNGSAAKTAIAALLLRRVPDRAQAPNREPPAVTSR